MQASDLKLYRARTNNDSPSNGGRESVNEVVGGVRNNILPDVSNSERLAGGVRYRKIFFHNKNTDNDVLRNVRIMILSPTTGQDEIVIFAGGHRDVQGDITGNEKQYGTGALVNDVNPGANSIVVAFFRASEIDIGAGDLLWLQRLGVGEWATVSGTPTWNGNQCTISLSSGLENGYPAGSIVAMVLPVAESLAPSFKDWTETTNNGTFDESSGLLLYNWGTVEDDWTLTFTSSTAFSVTGNYSGLVGNGSISSDFSPTNPETNTPYFTLKSTAWGGVWANGDRITWTTSPASRGIWVKHVWDAGVPPCNPNEFQLRLYGE